MGKFKHAFAVLVLWMGGIQFTPVAQAQSLFVDAPFPWGSEIPMSWYNLHGVWKVEVDPDSAPLIVEFGISKRNGGLYLVTSMAHQGGLEGGSVQGHAFVVEDQRHLNIPYFGDGIVPLGVIRAYASNYGLGPVRTQPMMTLTWVWNANSTRLFHQHLLMEKISSEPQF